MNLNNSSHFLFPSTLFVASERYSVKTILGSCVAVCLYDEKLKQGGINHYVLPRWDGRETPSPKYGNIAIQYLIKKLIGMGSQPKNLVAKIFGGADQFALTLGAGKSNIEEAIAILRKFGINVIEQNTGGTQGRTIVFDTCTGE